MVVFRYDRTFEGLLTVVFDAYFRNEFPEKLIGTGEPEPMFAGTVHTVVTDPVKSKRVWMGLGKKVPRYIRNMITYAWLSEEPQSDELIFRYLRKLFDFPEAAAGNFADDDMLKIKKLAQKVSSDGHYLRMFVRFQKAGDNSYFAPVAPQYNSLPAAVSYFTDRFADQKWLIYDVKRRYGYYYDLKEAREVTLEDDGHLLDGKLDEKLMAEDEKMFQELWKSYFKAMTIKERINPKLHRRNMPRRYWKYLTEKQ